MGSGQAGAAEAAAVSGRPGGTDQGSADAESQGSGPCAVAGSLAEASAGGGVETPYTMSSGFLGPFPLLVFLRNLSLTSRCRIQALTGLYVSMDRSS